MKISIFWFRRDLRLHDNTALNEALKSGHQVVPIFIFDDNILQDLPEDDARLSFIHERLEGIHSELRKYGASLHCFKGDPISIWKQITSIYDLAAVYLNKDYEPYAIKRDSDVKALLEEKGLPLFTYKDQVIFEEKEIIKEDGNPYTVFTPYKNKWLQTPYFQCNI